MEHERALNMFHVPYSTLWLIVQGRFSDCCRFFKSGRLFDGPGLRTGPELDAL